MRPWKHWTSRLRSEDGSASIEFVSLGVLLLIPIAYLMLSLASIQAAALSSEAAARTAARILAESGYSDDGRAAAELATAFALDAHGYDLDQATILVSCAPSPSNCADAGSLITVTVTVNAILPLVPESIGPHASGHIPVTSHATFQNSQFAMGGE